MLFNNRNAILIYIFFQIIELLQNRLSKIIVKYLKQNASRLPVVHLKEIIYLNKKKIPLWHFIQ